MAFSYDSNTAVTTSWQLVFRFKALLKLVGWIVKSSGDGTTFNSSGDQITSATTGSGGMANANSWFRIQDPGGTREFCMQTNGSIGQWRVKYSAQAKFTGGSPSATVMPTATDEQFLIGTSGTFVSWMNSTDATYRWNAAADAAAPYGFWSVGFRPNSIDGTTLDGVLVMDPMVTGTYPVSDADPVVLIASTSGTPFTSLTTQSNTQRAWYNYGQTGATFQQIQAMQYGASSTPLIPAQAEVLLTYFNKKFSYPLFWGRTTSGSQAAPNGWKGMSSIFKFNSSRFATGTAIGINTARDRICFGDINLPWNGSYPLL